MKLSFWILIILTSLLCSCEALVPTGELDADAVDEVFYSPKNASNKRAFVQHDGTVFFSYDSSTNVETIRKDIDRHLHSRFWQIYENEWLNNWNVYENTSGDMNASVLKTVWSNDAGALFSYNIETENADRAPPALIRMWLVPTHLASEYLDQWGVDQESRATQ